MKTHSPRWARRLIAGASTAAVIAVSAIAIPSASYAADDALPAKDAQFIEFAQAHSDDPAVIDRLSQKLFGTRYYVVLDGETIQRTGTDAAKVIREREATPVITPLADLPSDTFTITIGQSAISSGVYVTGSVIFKSTYAGQAAPADVASLQFSAPACITLNNHQINTYNQAGTSTNLGYLYNANVASKSPIWKINDSTSGFSNQAHRSAAYVLLQRNSCSGSQPISAAYRYEHNQGGSLGSISANFGFLSIGYSGAVFKIQKSSSVLNFNM